MFSMSIWLMAITRVFWLLSEAAIATACSFFFPHSQCPYNYNILCYSQTWYWRLQHGCSYFLIFCNLLYFRKVCKWKSASCQFEGSCWIKWLAAWLPCSKFGFFLCFFSFQHDLYPFINWLYCLISLNSLLPGPWATKLRGWKKLQGVPSPCPYCFVMAKVF